MNNFCAPSNNDGENDKRAILEVEIARLKRGEFTEEEFKNIAKEFIKKIQDKFDMFIKV